MKIVIFWGSPIIWEGEGCSNKASRGGLNNGSGKIWKESYRDRRCRGKYIQIVHFGVAEIAEKINALPSSLASRLDIRVYLTHIPSLLMTNRHKERMHSEYFMLTLFYCQPHCYEHFQVSCVTNEGIFRASCLSVKGLLKLFLREMHSISVSSVGKFNFDETSVTAEIVGLRKSDLGIVQKICGCEMISSWNGNKQPIT